MGGLLLRGVGKVGGSSPPAPIGTPVHLGSDGDGTNTATSLEITTGAASPAGAGIIVAVHMGSAGSLPIVTDSAGNTYTLTAQSGVAGKFWLAYCANAAALGSGGTISLSWTGAARGVINAISVTGLATASVLDVSGTSVQGTGTTGSVSTGTLAQAKELVLGVAATLDTHGTWTEASGFTSLPGAMASASAQQLEWAYQIVSATSSVTYAPSWVTSRTYGVNVYSFKGA